MQGIISMDLPTLAGVCILIIHKGYYFLEQKIYHTYAHKNLIVVYL
jgi:hypothetical protein